MKSIILVAFALVAVAVAAPADPAVEYPRIISSVFEQQPNGAYESSFKTENGIVREEQGAVESVLNEDNEPQDVVVVRGSFSYTDPEGNVQTISYTADGTGFHPEGPSIPKAPAARR